MNDKGSRTARDRGMIRQVVRAARSGEARLWHVTMTAARLKPACAQAWAAG